MVDPCFLCEMEKYSTEKLQDDAFFLERKNEFYPEEEYGDFVCLCTFHTIEVYKTNLELTEEETAHLLGVLNRTNLEKENDGFLSYFSKQNPKMKISSPHED